MKQKSKGLIADLSLLIVAMLWGGGFVVMKDALDSIRPYTIMAIRFSFAFLIMSVIFFKKFKKIRKKDIKSGTIIGFFLFVAFATQTVGLLYTTASKQAFLTATNVVMVPFLVWGLNKKRPDTYSIIGAFLAVWGIGMLTLDGGLSLNKGDILTLICAFFFACHITSIGHYAQDSDPILLTIIQFGAASVFFIACVFVFEDFNTGFSPDMMNAVAYLVLGSTLMAFLIQNIAQKYTTSSHAAIILCLEAVFGTLFAVLILKEVLSMKMIIGCIIIFIGIIITETRLEFLKKDKNKKSKNLA